MKLIYTAIAFLLITAVTEGCSAVPVNQAVETPSAVNTVVPGQTPTPVETAIPTTTPAPTSTPVTVENLPMICKDQGLLVMGRYRAENNTWGKGTIRKYSQCIGLSTSLDGKAMARWTWNWPDQGANVKAYPELIYGQKPMNVSTVKNMPILTSDIKTASINLESSSNHTGTGNLAFDIWLTDTNSPSSFTAPPITHEIMIWLDYYGGMVPGGERYGRVMIDGIDYEVYVGKNFSAGWTYIAFAPIIPGAGSIKLDLLKFLAYIKDQNLASGQEYLASIEFGNEVINGSGETLVKNYQVIIQ